MPAEALLPPPTAQRCALYAHRPAPLRLVVHHVLPLAMSGLDEPANRTDPICDNCHYGIHRLLGALILGQPLPGGFPRLRALAEAGYDQWVKAGRPGRPVFEAHPIALAESTTYATGAATVYPASRTATVNGKPAWTAS